MQNQSMNKNFKRIAIVGAGGYVGMRLTEIFLTEKKYFVNIVPIVRSHKSFARISKYGINCSYADAGNLSQIKNALTNCDVVINLTMGDHSNMVLETENIFKSCETNKVPLLIQISSAEIYGRCISKDIDEKYILKKHWMKYAREKYASDEFLKKSFQSKITKIIILRPGLIWGPNSGWVTEPIKALINGNATLHADGKGAANLIFIENLAKIIINFIYQKDVKSDIYNVADPEKITWLEYYIKLANSIGIKNPVISYDKQIKYKHNINDFFEIFGNYYILKKLKKIIPNEYKIKLKKYIHDKKTIFKFKDDEIDKANIGLSKSQWWIQGTVNHVSTYKFSSEFGDFEYINHEEAFKLTSHWLEFAGYKV